MDELLVKQLLRQLKIINTFMIILVVTFLTFFIVTGVVVYKAVQEVRDAKNSINSLQDKLQGNINLKTEICDSDSSVSDLLKNRSEICK